MIWLFIWSLQIDHLELANWKALESSVMLLLALCWPVSGRSVGNAFASIRDTNITISVTLHLALGLSNVARKEEGLWYQRLQIRVTFTLLQLMIFKHFCCLYIKSYYNQMTVVIMNQSFTYISSLSKEKHVSPVLLIFTFMPHSIT